MNRRRGFTLFELIVSLAVLSVVSTLAVSAFVSALGYWNQLSAAVLLNQNATAALDSLRADFGDVLSQRLSGGALRAAAGSAVDDRHLWRSTFEDDSFQMAVEQYNVASRQRETATARYFVDRSSGAPRLVRAAGAGETVVAANVAGMRLSWFDGRQWLGSWDRAELPRAVRVSLSLVDPDRPTLNIARTEVFNVNVQ